MIIDTSALVAIAMDEPEATALIEVLVSERNFRISAGRLLELYLVIDRRQNAKARRLLTSLMTRMAVAVEQVTESQVVIAREAARRYGRASGHPTRLNYDDCFTYPLAKERSGQLLFIGNDFAQTDIVLAL